MTDEIGTLGRALCEATREKIKPEPKPEKPEDRANAEFNALPFEDRKRICNFLNMERIRELERQKRIHREAIADLDETIRVTRQWIYSPENKN
jgi:hypothetical protein